MALGDCDTFQATTAPAARRDSFGGKGVVMIRRFCFLGILAVGLGCDSTSHPVTSGRAAESPKPAAMPVAVVPDGFDQRLLEILRCPENLTVLRLATRAELDATTERIKARQIKSWGGKAVTLPIEAMLIRADGKIGYRFEGAAPVMIIEEALVLDATVGVPDPDKHRK